MRALGRLTPPDFEHVEKYPLTAATAPAVPTSVVGGYNWYSNFDDPVRDSRGHWWVGRAASLGSIRGGHCTAFKPLKVTDNLGWWEWYNQINEGICVGEGVCRMQTLNNRARFQPRWLYDVCKQRDGYPNEEGTFVRVGLDVVKDYGLVRTLVGESQILTPGGVTRYPNSAEGISVYRWARSAEDVADVLGYGGLGYVEFVNSWGKDYPHFTRMPLEVLQRLLDEDGEFGVATDK